MPQSRPDLLRLLTIIDFDRIRRLARMIAYAEQHEIQEFTFTFLLATGERITLRIIPGESYPGMHNFGEQAFDALRDEIRESYELAQEKSGDEKKELMRNMRECVTEFKNLKARIAHLLATKLYYGVLGRMSSETIANVHFRLSNDSTQRSAGGFRYAYGQYYNAHCDSFDNLYKLRNETYDVLGEVELDELKATLRDWQIKRKEQEDICLAYQRKLETLGANCDAIQASIQQLDAEYKSLKELLATKMEGEDDKEIAQLRAQMAEKREQYKVLVTKAKEAVAEHNSVSAVYRQNTAAYQEINDRISELENEILQERREILRKRTDLRRRNIDAFEHHARVEGWMDEVEQQIARSPSNPLHAHALMVISSKHRCAEAREELAELRTCSYAYSGRDYFFDMPREEGNSMQYVRHRESLPPPRDRE